MDARKQKGRREPRRPVMASAPIWFCRTPWRATDDPCAAPAMAPRAVAGWWEGEGARVWGFSRLNRLILDRPMMRPRARRAACAKVRGSVVKEGERETASWRVVQLKKNLDFAERKSLKLGTNHSHMSRESPGSRTLLTCLQCACQRHKRTTSK
jgi:hypothetical protein